MGVYFSKVLTWSADGTKLDSCSENDEVLNNFLARFERFFDSHSETLASYVFFSPLHFQTSIVPSQFPQFPDAEKFQLEDGKLRVVSKEKALSGTPLFALDRSSGISITRIFSFPYLFGHLKHLPEESDIRKDLRGILEAHDDLVKTIVGPPTLESALHPPPLTSMNSSLALGSRTPTPPSADGAAQSSPPHDMLMQFSALLAQLALASVEHPASPPPASGPSHADLVRAFTKRHEVLTLLMQFEKEIHSEDLTRTKRSGCR